LLLGGPQAIRNSKVTKSKICRGGGNPERGDSESQPQLKENLDKPERSRMVKNGSHTPT